ncbi:unnamed protein product [Soboliphyme baturini]|uniref:TPR_REGION domain-containing protein n=1 Tax=Soboliphyme baturini TaxID=241478 RepID=A0A183IPR5_9BILA|nr:unnamed protein product [Soboliphyme baturini]
MESQEKTDIEQPPDFLKSFESQIEEINDFKCSFYITSSTPTEACFNAELENKVSDLLSSIKKCPELPKYLQAYLLGKALNLYPKYVKECEEQLTRCIRLNPSFPQALNELGECVWKRSDINGAKKCFLAGLKLNKDDKACLRNLSMAYRHLGGENGERLKNCAESLELAKRAVELDPDDGMSLCACWDTI